MGIRVKTEGALPAAVSGLFVLRGRDRQALAATLERIAGVAPHLADCERDDLAGQLWHDTAAASKGAPGADGEIRVAVVARDARQLAERARVAADLTSVVRTGPVIGGAGVHVSCGAAGRVVLVFPGGAATAAAGSATLARSLRALRWLDRLGVTPVAAVGHGLGEIAGLVWAGSLPATEAARLVAQHGEVRRGAGGMQAAVVRVGADAAAAAALSDSCGLAVAAYEGPRSQVLAGSVAAVRELTRQAAATGIAAEVLDAGHALYTPAMAPFVAPLRSVLSQIRFGPPRRRLVSTVTARSLTSADDIAELLCAQLTSPVRFGDALQAAAADADLLFLAGHDESLAALASDFPATTFASGPAGGDDDAACVAALFAAGAMPDGARLPRGQARPAVQPRLGQAAPAVYPRPDPAEPAAPVRPGPAAAAVPEPAAGQGRFMDNVTVLRPGSELTAEARISLSADPYLADYVLDGRAVLPAAIGLEAMAQAASTLAGRPMRRARRVSFGDPVVIADGEETLLRLEARLRGDGVETILRAGSPGELAECARAVFAGLAGPGWAAATTASSVTPASSVTTSAATVPASSATPGAATAPAGSVAPGAAVTLAAAVAVAGGGPLTPVRASSTGRAPITMARLCGPPGVVADPGRTNRPELADSAEIVDGTDLYGTVCFQTGRFRRVALVSRNPPRSCLAIVRGHDDAPWFGCLPQPTGPLILGSPGLNDAALQVVQACVPGRRLLPGGCDSITASGDEVPGAVALQAFLISGPGDGTAASRTGTDGQNGTGTSRAEHGGSAAAGEYVWDVHGYDAAGTPVLAWIGLRVRDAGPLPASLPRFEAVTSPAPSRPAPALRALA